MTQEIAPEYVSPSLKRRLLCMIYEAFLVFGVIVFFSAIHDIATGSRDPSMHRISRIVLIFIVCGVYFVYFWSRSGQTLAMQTWHIKIVDNYNQRITIVKAFARYCLAWMWFLPGTVISYSFSLTNIQKVVAIAIGFCAWALTVFMNKDGQYLHDVLAKTRLIILPQKTQSTESVEDLP